MRARRSWIVNFAIILGACLGTITQALGEVSFAGKTIEWIIPFSDAGGTATWAHFNAPFLSRHLPGNPTIKIANEPGGGGTRGPNIFQSTARPDGLTILGTSGSTQFPYLLGDLRVHYNYDDWVPVMVAPTGGVVYVAAETGVEGPEDIGKLMGQTLVFASQGPTSLDLVPMLAFRLLGLDVSYVFGYTGRGDGLAAMKQNEVTIDYQTTASYLRNVVPMVAAGEAVPLMSWGILDDDGEMRRDPTFPDLPIVEEIYEMLHGRPPSGMDYEAYHAFNIAGFSAQKMVVLPGGTPPDIIETWRRAWRNVFNDPDYQRTAASVLGKYEQVTDRTADVLFQAGTTIDAGVREYVIDLLTDEYSVRLKYN